MVDVGLPEEVWVHVFGFLSSADKLSARSSCRFFRRLIDQPALWRNSTVYLEKPSSYRSHFWRTLGRRRTSSAVVLKGTKVREWTELARRLPWLVSLTLRACGNPKALEALAEFKKLQRLEIRLCRCPSLSNSLTALSQLTHLGFCEVSCAPGADITGAVSQLSNLTSFSYHEGNKLIPKAALHKLLRNLTNLKRLSLKLLTMQGSLPSDYLCPAKTNWQPGESKYETLGLTSLELLNYMDPVLSSGALQSFPCLTSLTVQYRDWASDSCPCHLKTWLSTLPVLSELSISRGHPLGMYSDSVPGTVRSLSLKGVRTELRTVRDMAQQLPDLLFLHLDLYCHEKQNLIAEVPQLFPKVQTLEMRHHNVPKTEFLQLAQMTHLKRLVVLDPYMDPSSALTDLTNKLHLLTNSRVRVIHSSELRDRNACLCAQH
ncbi:hypothetical protein AMEX_G17152 [Astyanax mexicanus]|uniref:Uncharacterized LOC103044683 n=1 Tax=Astyanax mexicanus TaxID=7994 RepID=A0A8B9LQT1_ASTMX|nr:hypothetical protein AMEX_G17152 [Astyanax mexicanus]